MQRIRDMNKPGLLIFTSGSTGRPKGAAMRRYNLLMHALLLMWKNDIRKGFNILQMLPVHHATGLIQNTVPAILGGGTVEFTLPKFDAATIWERIRQGGITSVSTVPTIYTRLLRHYEEILSRSPEEKEDYRAAMGRIEIFQSGTSALPSAVSTKWNVKFGRRILERYGGTEFGNPYANYAGSKLVLVRRWSINMAFATDENSRDRQA
jgi:malonyl-CoA/methylmalonyl-CoA synthetase